ncbi:MAG: hypothetical protein V5A68_05890 [Candidatus Thermoplasmatota archaeon]
MVILVKQTFYKEKLKKKLITGKIKMKYPPNSKKEKKIPSKTNKKIYKKTGELTDNMKEKYEDIKKEIDKIHKKRRTLNQMEKKLIKKITNT